jgi:AraC-like DNA-binding protein
MWHADATPPQGAAIPSPHRAELDQAALKDCEALRAFVDACQVLVGQLDRGEDESATRMRVILMRVLRRAARSSPQRTTTSYRVARVMRHLEDTFADSTIRLVSAAQYVDVTPPHLDRLLKEHTGLTFLQQLRRIRMRHAEALLLTTMSSIKETAYACGYTSTGSFGRDFRRVYGCSPREWRDLRTALAAEFD